MKAIVTCGPSFEPIDQVRRLTNFSTGELGTVLSGQLASSGWEVICCRGEGSVAAAPSGKHITVKKFSTNSDLEKKLHALSEDSKINAIFHGAALSDFRIERITDGRGNTLSKPKISSSIEKVTLVLEPAAKILTQLRPLFPKAAIVGWKYELEGKQEDAIAKARQQIRECQTDACVINGAAYGEGFGFCVDNQPVKHFKTKPELAAFLVEWLKQKKLD